MLYLNQNDILSLGKDWRSLVHCISQAVEAIVAQDFAQPVKPYLRYRSPKNRIIAMPAFVGDSVHMSGIKWIASFPGNLEVKLPRAHSVTILNDPATGVPKSIINTALVSGLRTAAVSGYIVNEWLQITERRGLKIGITGFGPIGGLHLEMLHDLLGDKIHTICIYDIKGVDTDQITREILSKVVVGASWEEAYNDADIFVTCTVSDKPYVDKAPKAGSLQLNVSLRDYKPEVVKWVDVMTVDDWTEVCRENTDIENMHKKFNLQAHDVFSIADIHARRAIRQARPADVIMFNPMGMAIFDIAIATYYFRIATQKAVGTSLPA